MSGEAETMQDEGILTRISKSWEKNCLQLTGCEYGERGPKGSI